ILSPSKSSLPIVPDRKKREKRCQGQLSKDHAACKMNLKTHVAASCAWRYVGTTTVSTSPSDRRQPCHFTQLSICIPATACWPSWMARAKRCCSVDDPTICRDCLVIWHR